MKRQHENHLVLGILMTLGMVFASLAFAGNIPFDASYLFDAGPNDSSGGFGPAVLGGAAAVSGGCLHIGDNNQDYAGLDNAILDGRTDYTLTIRFMIDTLKDRNALVYVMDLVGGGTQLAIETFSNHGINHELAWNMGGVWTYTGVALAADTWYEIEAMRFGSTFWLYLNDQMVSEDTNVSTAPLAVSSAMYGGIELPGILLGQDPYQGGTPPFGVGTSLAGCIDYVVAYAQAPVPTVNKSFGAVKALFRN